MDNVINYITQSGGHKIILSIFIYFLISFVGYKLSYRVIDKISVKIDPTALHWKLLKQLIRVVWIVIFIIGVIDSVPGSEKLGTAFVASSSVIVAAIGLASQDALGNAIDGVFISLFKPFSVGDRIRLVSRNITGTVSGINLRYTTIKTVENNILMIPNSIMNDEIIENSNIDDQKIKTFLDVSVGYESDMDLVKSVLSDVVAKHPYFVDTRSDDEIKQGEPIVGINVRNFGASGVDIRVTLCAENINKSFKLSSDLREEILKEFRKNNINIPYNIVEIHTQEIK